MKDLIDGVFNTPNSSGQGQANDPKIVEWQRQQEMYYPSDRPIWVGHILMKLDDIQKQIREINERTR